MEIETRDDAEAVELLLESMSPCLSGKERRAWVLAKFDALTRLGLSRARAVELLSQYSGYSKMQIYRIVTNVTKEAESELNFQKKPIKIEPEIAAKVKQIPIAEAWKDIEPNSVDLILTDPPYAYENLEVWSYLPEIYRRLNELVE